MEGSGRVLIALHFCRKDREQALRLAEWLAESGPFNHDILVARDHRAEPITAFEKAFRALTEIVIRDDTADQWCASANHAFKRIGKHIQHSMGAVAFLLIEPDCVILRASAFDETEAEYQRALAGGKRFVGQLIDQRGMGVDSPPHMSGVAVYAADLVQHAGIIYQADNVPFDIVAGPQIVPQMMQSELILHNWKAAPFESWADVERRIFAVRPKCAVFHSDKSGSLLGLLRERKNFSEDVLLRTNEAIKGLARSWPLDRTECAPPAETIPSSAVSGFPVEPELTSIGGLLRGERHSISGVTAGETAQSQPDSAAETVPLGGKGAHGIECTCLKPDFPCPFHFRDYEGAVFLPTEIKCPERPLTLSESNANAKTIILEAWMGQTPWASKADSIAEIRQLAARLMQFSDSSPHVRLVRAELHNAGVIRLAYRFKKRRGWKRKKGKPPAPAL